MGCGADAEPGDEIYNEAHGPRDEVVDDAFIIAGDEQFDRLVLRFYPCARKKIDLFYARNF